MRFSKGRGKSKCVKIHGKTQHNALKSLTYTKYRVKMS
nr:MAG TPA: hypothetical protein [Caudoviricetes sp.]